MMFGRVLVVMARYRLAAIVNMGPIPGGSMYNMRSTIITIEDQPLVYRIDGAGHLRNATQTNVPLRGCAFAYKAYLPVYSMGQGTWVCVVCCRLGKDLRQLMCPFSEVR
jgi:hypothetical protein